MESFSLVGWFRTPMVVTALAGLVLLALYLTIWHTAHFVSVLPLLLLLACPLMHLFMHAGHGSHDQHADHTATADPLAQGPHARHTMHGQMHGQMNGQMNDTAYPSGVSSADASIGTHDTSASRAGQSGQLPNGGLQ